MLFQVIEENGQKKIQPLTADAGAGNPVGTVIVVCSNQIPCNYLPLGTQYDTSLYPVLYALLGTDTTPTASALGLPTLTSGQYAIKATSGLTENQQENVLNTINENNSYSTEEHPTGKKWIDGKPIYRKVIDCGGMPNASLKNIPNVLSNIDYVISIQGSASNGSVILPLPYSTSEASNNDSIQVYIADNKTSLNFICKSNLSSYLGYVTVEYTKAS